LINPSGGGGVVAVYTSGAWWWCMAVVVHGSGGGGALCSIMLHRNRVLTVLLYYKDIQLILNRSPINPNVINNK